MVAAIPSSRIRLLLASAGAPALSRTARRDWSPSAESACAARFGDLVVIRPFQDVIERGVPTSSPTRGGRWDRVRTLILDITVAQPLAYEGGRAPASVRGPECLFGKLFTRA
jgi:hypothetical protein